MSNALSSGAASQNAIQDALTSPCIDVNLLRETYATAREQDAEIERGDDEESSEILLTESEDEEENDEAPGEAALDNDVADGPIFDDDLNMDDSNQHGMRELFRRRRNMGNLLHLITVSKAN